MWHTCPFKKLLKHRELQLQSCSCQVSVTSFTTLATPPVHIPCHHCEKFAAAQGFKFLHGSLEASWCRPELWEREHPSTFSQGMPQHLKGSIQGCVPSLDQGLNSGAGEGTHTLSEVRTSHRTQRFYYSSNLLLSFCSICGTGHVITVKVITLS